MNYEILNDSELPSGFKYPESYLKTIKLHLVNLEPWIIMDKGQVISGLEGLSKRYPERELIPFARRLDNDDVACFELSKGDEVQIIHDFASAGYEQREVFTNYWDWFKEAINQMIDFD